MVKFLFLIVFAFCPLYSQIEPQRMEELRLKLLSIHGVDWKSLNERFSKKELRLNLLDIYQNIDSHYSEKEVLGKKIAKNNALNGYAIFSEFKNKEVLGEQRDVLEDIVKNSSSKEEKLNALVSLKYLGDKKSIDLMLDYLESSEDAREILGLSDAISHSIKSLDLSNVAGDMHYIPKKIGSNNEKSIFERLNREEINSLYKRIEKTFSEKKSIIKSKSLAINLSSYDLLKKEIKEKLKKKKRSIGSVSLKDQGVNIVKKKSEHKRVSPREKKMMKEKREISSEQIVSKWYLNPFFILFTLLSFSLLFIFRRFRS